LEKITDLLKYIDERLGSLEGEKEELKEYQKWDKMRRSLEYTIYHQELEDARKKKHDLEKMREESSSGSEKLREELSKLQVAIKESSRDLKEAKAELQTIRDEKKALNHEHQSLLKEKTRLELRLKDLKDEVEGDSKSKSRAEKELEGLKAKIRENQDKLNEIRPEYDQMKQKEEQCTRELSLKEQKRSELYAKQGRGSQFTSKSERDTWINNELRSLTRNVEDKKSQIKRLKTEMARDTKRKEELDTKIDVSICLPLSISREFEIEIMKVINQSIALKHASRSINQS
jgi:structural maintenance of chromosome 3 (chondroitin sulfate proteoglycan 6)